MKHFNKKNKKNENDNITIMDWLNRIIGNNKKRYYLTFAIVIISLITIFTLMSLWDII